MPNKTPSEIIPEKNTGKSPVFISYRRANKETAHRIFKALQERGVDAWYDALIEPGRNWRDAIVENLQNAGVMLILLSENALASEELKKELAVAKASKVPLLAVRLEDVKLTGAFAYELEGLNWFDLFDAPEERLAELSGFIEELVKSPKGDKEILQTSIKAFRSGRQPWLPWYKRLLYNQTALLSWFCVISILQFLLLEFTNSTMKLLIEENELSFFTALFYVLIAATIASPILFFQVFVNGITLKVVPLLFTSVINTMLMFQIIRIFFRQLLSKIRPPKSKTMI